MTNIVKVEFREKKDGDDGDGKSVTLHCCTNCRNKTFTAIEDDPNKLPMLTCAACGADIDRIAWTNSLEGPPDAAG